MYRFDKTWFLSSNTQKKGRPSYTSQVFLKIYLYGYHNGLRSSCKLENECFRNIEIQWLYLTGLEKVNGEHSLIMLVYNIKCSINILGVPDLIAKPKNGTRPTRQKPCF
ncbi:transposase [Flavobacterium sp. LB1P62]|uniref:transposase n=1 Tax=Flavobacterium sp. LB1P62 TaxID=3401715 RepID=UPI003AAF8C9E